MAPLLAVCPGHSGRVRCAGTAQGAESGLVSPPVTRYAKSGGVNIAYQVIGNGPVDLVFVPGWVSHLELCWEDPLHARFFRRLASFSRLILFDKRGTGLSDRVPERELPTLEERMDDVRAVMDAAGSERAALFGFSEGGAMSILFAATYPQRTAALVLSGTYAYWIRDDDIPWAPTREQHEETARLYERRWGEPVGISAFAPTMAKDPEFRRRWATYLRMAASPGAAVALLRMNFDSMFGRFRLGACPTLVLHRRGDGRLRRGRAPPGRAIPGARLVELRARIIWPGWATAMRSSTRSRSSSPGAAGGRARPGSGHRAVHRHRGVHRAGCRARGPAMAGAARCAWHRCGPPARAFPGAPGEVAR